MILFTEGGGRISHLCFQVSSGSLVGGGSRVCPGSKVYLGGGE